MRMISSCVGLVLVFFWGGPPAAGWQSAEENKAAMLKRFDDFMATNPSAEEAGVSICRDNRQSP
jgi:hypothetical protein